MLSQRAGCVGVLLLLWSQLSCGASSDPELRWLPAGVAVGPTAQSVRINGVNTRVFRLHAALSVNELQTAFETETPRMPPLAPAQQTAGWQVVARFQQGTLQTLQLRQHGDAVEGLLAITELSQRPRGLPQAPVRLPSGTLLTSVVESDDEHRRATQFVAWSSQAPDRVRRALCTRAAAAGWQVRDCATPAATLVRGPSSLALAVADIPWPRTGAPFRTLIVMNHVEARP